nr:hypothetical protein [Sphingomonadaceae bacterium]
MAYTGRPGAASLAQRFGELSTSIKMLAIISLALVPLGLIALLASLQSSRTTDMRRQAELRVAVTESTRNLAAELASDMSSLGAAANALDIGASADQVCARLSAILAASRHPTPFALYGVDDRAVCATGARPARPA